MGFQVCENQLHPSLFIKDFNSKLQIEYTVNQGNWCLSIKLRLECFVIVAQCKQHNNALTYSKNDTKIQGCWHCLLLAKYNSSKPKFLTRPSYASSSTCLGLSPNRSETGIKYIGMRRNDKVRKPKVPSQPTAENRATRSNQAKIMRA